MRAGLAFVAFELFLTFGPPQSWLRIGFKANPKLRVDQIEEAIRQAKSRLVGSLHLLIQARLHHPPNRAPAVRHPTSVAWPPTAPCAACLTCPCCLLACALWMQSS